MDRRGTGHDRKGEKTVQYTWGHRLPSRGKGPTGAQWHSAGPKAEACSGEDEPHQPDGLWPPAWGTALPKGPRAGGQQNSREWSQALHGGAWPEVERQQTSVFWMENKEFQTGHLPLLFWNLICQIWELPQRRGNSILSVRKRSLPNSTL